jgi:glycosyltransferase involved in cell wall biosynthesis
VGELKEIIKNGRNGFLINPGDAEQLSGLLVKVLENYGTYGGLGYEARKTARDFSIEKTISSYLDIYRGVMAKNEIPN